MSDILAQAREREEDAEEYYREEEARMLEDFRFSNPANPEQWDAADLKARQGAEGGPRPCITEDYTNQYIAQVENDGRQNKPGIELSPGDSEGSKQAALELEGYIRQIEYSSRADIAYATSLSHAARGGRGWIRVGTKMANPELNQQEICILAVHDPLTVRLDRDSREPDGSDAVWGFVYADISIKAFKKQFGEERSLASWGNNSVNAPWNQDGKMIRIAEHYWIETRKVPHLNLVLPDQSLKQIPASDWERESQQTQMVLGAMPRVLHEYDLEQNEAWYTKLSGDEVLEKPVRFPSQWIPLVPVFGHMLWINGKRYVSGLSRQLRDGQRMKNFERSAWVEWLAMQPRAPWVVAAESIEGYKNQWKNANRTNAAYLPFNAFNEDGDPLPPPQRTQPPMGGQAFAQGSAMATEAMQGSVGMYRSNFGAPSNAVSGKAKLADQREGDTSTFHYQDNRSRSIAHIGRIIVDMIPKTHAMSADGSADQKREVRSLSYNGTAKILKFDATAPRAYQDTNDGPVVNPTIGKYAVRVKVGPAYHSLQEEASTNLNELLKAMPQLMSVIGPYWARMQRGPESEHLAKLLMTIATPAVQEIENQNSKLPPEAQNIVLSLQQQLQQSGQQLEQMQQAMTEMQQKLIEKETKAQADLISAQSGAQKDQADTQIRMGELALKERELGLREREMGLRELEVQAKTQPQGDNMADLMDQEIKARQVEIQAYQAETERMRVEQEGLTAARQMELDAQTSVMEAERDARETEKKGADEERVRNDDAAANENSQQQAAAILAQIEALQELVQSITAPKQKVSRAVKQADGTWLLESVEKPVTEGAEAAQE